jgi:hypothetical protein
MQTVNDPRFILTFAAAPENPVSKHQVLTTMAHVSPGVSRDMQFLHSQNAVIANVKKLNNITNENVKAGKRYITTFGDLSISDIPSIARNLTIHSILSSRVPGGGLDEDSWNRLPLKDPGVLPLPETADYEFLWYHVPWEPTLIGNATGFPNDTQDPHCDCKWTAEGVPEDPTSIILFLRTAEGEGACLGFPSVVSPEDQAVNVVVSFAQATSVAFNGAHNGVKGSGYNTAIRLHVQTGEVNPGEYDAWSWSCVCA